ncbi:hypothetical protein P167DRAFT_533168 [Morchella conica CCBAS932]|uniref:Uncharacterized protein n=1 Tax=Morchella conica CCBAS932 TaxID=1392247 RepID=A0A3N4KXT3_9PEZI|nr:hypothetical protein P167DRAFT_533168 [Morchella conica CCBAS932]
MGMFCFVPTYILHTSYIHSTSYLASPPPISSYPEKLPTPLNSLHMHPMVVIFTYFTKEFVFCFIFLARRDGTRRDDELIETRR